MLIHVGYIYVTVEHLIFNFHEYSLLNNLPQLNICHWGGVNSDRNRRGTEYEILNHVGYICVTDAHLA